jgi:hypothetical protein
MPPEYGQNPLNFRLDFVARRRDTAPLARASTPPGSRSFASDGGDRGMGMGPRKPDDGVTRGPGAESATNREAGVRAALRERRRRRADEAGLQSLVRRLATEMSGGRGR